MPEYRVRFMRTTECFVNVEADNEESAIDEAYGELPVFSAQESGWGSFGKWSADAGDWLTVDEFYWDDYSEEKYGPVVEEVE